MDEQHIHPAGLHGFDEPDDLDQGGRLRAPTRRRHDNGFPDGPEHRIRQHHGRRRRDRTGIRGCYAGRQYKGALRVQEFVNQFVDDRGLHSRTLGRRPRIGSREKAGDHVGIGALGRSLGAMDALGDCKGDGALTPGPRGDPAIRIRRRQVQPGPEGNQAGPAPLLLLDIPGV